MCTAASLRVPRNSYVQGGDGGQSTESFLKHDLRNITKSTQKGLGNKSRGLVIDVGDDSNHEMPSSTRMGSVS